MRTVDERRELARVMHLRDEYVSVPLVKALALPAAMVVGDYIVIRQLRGWHDERHLASKVCVDGAYANLHPKVVRAISGCRIGGKYEVDDGERFIAIVRAAQDMAIQSSIVLNGRTRRTKWLVYANTKLHPIEGEDFLLLVELRYDTVFNSAEVAAR